MIRKDEAIKHFGGVTKLAKALDVSRSAVNQWGEFVPDGRAYQLELITGGELKATPSPDTHVA